METSGGKTCTACPQTRRLPPRVRKARRSQRGREARRPRAREEKGLPPLSLPEPAGPGDPEVTEAPLW
ncbi:hypothetical protein CSW38_02200 [Thermus scotoductus]|uniref:Uncharacterized protein n=1 Tax=Thermus scotoductus TaxID=37636 RepID=A0A430S2R5_THESC|nr:hypothetical protein CSW51_01470 [Thermus scotoductus]RTH27927.1 hypothetical protein CSW38_02200 [Thermus scotoductus]